MVKPNSLFRRSSSFCVLAAINLSTISIVHAATPLTVVATYDAAGSGSVSTNASGNALGSVLLNDVAGFTPAVASAFGSSTGGVINFGTAGVAGIDANQLGITYGGGKTFVISSTVSYFAGSVGTSQTVDIRDNLSTLTPISGLTALLPSQTLGASAWSLDFGGISNGIAGEGITTMGFTLLSRSGSTQTATIQWFINGSTTAVFSDAEDIANASGTDNTFFSYTAPAGSAITGIKVNFGGGSATGDRRLGIDDIGFITGVIPEPGSSVLLALTAGLLATRRRR